MNDVHATDLTLKIHYYQVNSTWIKVIMLSFSLTFAGLAYLMDPFHFNYYYKMVKT